MLGKNKNKELAHVLDTDKSFTSKQIKELEEQGLVTREGEGKETTYSVDRFNLMKFLESKVVIKWGKGKPKEPNAQENEDSKNG
jgi:Mn-dependent DtxR family transcriptional regulator